MLSTVPLQLCTAVMNLGPGLSALRIRMPWPGWKLSQLRTGRETAPALTGPAVAVRVAPAAEARNGASVMRMTVAEETALGDAALGFVGLGEAVCPAINCVVIRQRARPLKAMKISSIRRVWVSAAFR